MAINIVDSVNSILQAVFFICLPDYCILDKYKQDKINKFISILFIFSIMQIFNRVFGNLSICVFFIHFMEISILFILYRKAFYSALITYTIIYFLIALNVTIFGNLFFGYLKDIIYIQNIERLMIAVVYTPQFIMGIICLLFRKRILNFHNYIRSIAPTMSTLIIINFSLDFIVAFYLIFYKEESELLKNIGLVSSLVFVGAIAIYFLKIHMRSSKILALNKVLDEKNSELRKIKNNYSNEISYMYDLYSRENLDEIGQILKNIINKSNSNINNETSNNTSNNTLISSIIKNIKSEDLNVIVDESGSIENVEMQEIELYRVISNIINNAIKAMDGIGIIIVKTYNSLDNLIISIENNGPKIEPDHISKIFEAGFTTKKDLDKNHGFGLNIVRELVEKYKGKISVESTDASTKFEIRLPFLK
ncbi:sensor histidine kinase [Clostridium weizhouense]|uniref:histidine kinase n=1 Tax=Clostridium weizhouense TaxID=2859781 RepID=A0ABS7AKN3_9CLOT|nr:ATP-binding protein [Clostridium weizhouense]MBW6408658.1 ATP-binding protein [Clostridium weizhouense]